MWDAQLGGNSKLYITGLNGNNRSQITQLGANNKTQLENSVRWQLQKTQLGGNHKITGLGTQLQAGS